MNVSTRWGVFAAVLALLLGLWLLRVGMGIRRRRGLGSGKTVSLDNVTLVSHRLGLVGRPDRLVKGSGTIVPEEWKSSQTPRLWHRAQLGVYFVLIEEQLRVRPPYGFIACGSGQRHRVENTEELRASVLRIAEQIRAARRQVNQPIPVRPEPWRCRPCGLRRACGQATG